MDRKPSAVLPVLPTVAALAGAVGCGASRAGNVNGVNDLWNVGSGDLAFTSLKNP